MFDSFTNKIKTINNTADYLQMYRKMTLSENNINKTKNIYINICYEMPSTFLVFKNNEMTSTDTTGLSYNTETTP